MENKEILNKYLEQIKIEMRNVDKKEKMFVLGFVGINGVGKSYIANLISSRMNIYIASNDKIRRFLNCLGIDGDNPNQELVQQIAEESSRFLFKNGISHIIDADLLKFYKNASNNAKLNGAEFFLIKLVCPEDLILSRLKNRVGEKNNFSKAGVEEYYKRKEIYKNTSISDDDIFYKIDTSDDVNLQIDILIEKINKNLTLK